MGICSHLQRKHGCFKGASICLCDLFFSYLIPRGFNELCGLIYHVCFWASQKKCYKDNGLLNWLCVEPAFTVKIMCHTNATVLVLNMKGIVK